MDNEQDIDVTALVGKTIAGYRWVDSGGMYGKPSTYEGIVLIFTDATELVISEAMQAGAVDFAWKEGQ